jgi:hypothetical protein
MQQAAEKLQVPLKLIIGKGMGHAFDPASRNEFMAFHAANVQTGRPKFVPETAFASPRRHSNTTAVTGYPSSKWNKPAGLPPRNLNAMQRGFSRFAQTTLI